MIMYALIMLIAFLGLVLFSYGLSIELMFFEEVGVAIWGIYGFIPVTVYYIIGGFFLVLCALVAAFIRIRMSGCNKRFDKLKRGKGLFNFIYRDGGSTDVYGDRIPGLGFFQIPKLGIVVDTGRNPSPGSVYNFGDKKIRFALQDINYTPNPKFANFYSYLVILGFNNMTEVQDVFNGYNPDLIVKVWNNMLNREKMETAEDKLVSHVQTMSKKELRQNDKSWGRSMKERKGRFF